MGTCEVSVSRSVLSYCYLLTKQFQDKDFKITYHYSVVILILDQSSISKLKLTPCLLTCISESYTVSKEKESPC